MKNSNTCVKCGKVFPWTPPDHLDYAEVVCPHCGAIYEVDYDEEWDFDKKKDIISWSLISQND